MNRRSLNRRRLAVTSVALAAVLVLSGCVGSFLPSTPSSTSKSTSEKVAANLEPFYSQVLHWKSCESGNFQCATAKAPLDWSDPGKETIRLALIRKVATGTKLGSLLVNPGGPGASGFDFIKDSLSYAVDAKLRQNFDIVGFDPRGVNHSSAVKCYDNPANLDAFLFTITPGAIGSDQWLAASDASNAKFGQDCLKYTGNLLGYIDTNSAARDLDLLRATLGDKKLNYLGYSYGTLLGATYAELYPKKTGHLVLDGVVDPATTEYEVTETQAKGFESAMRAYLKDCLSGTKCPFKGTVNSSMLRVRAILDSLDASPIRNGDGRELGSATMFEAIILPLYSQSTWKYLDTLFTDVEHGSADVAFQLADSYVGRNADGTYRDNSFEALIAINCLDYKSTDTDANMRVEAAQLDKVAPTFGPEMSYGGTSCNNWPFKSTRERGPIAANGSAPIVVIGTTNDPATPYVWAQNLSKELQHGYLITHKGEGHTAYNKSNSCVNNAVDDFFVSNKVPLTDPHC